MAESQDEKSPPRTPTLSVLCFDYGFSRIGVASGQSFTGTANPVTTLTSLSGQPDWNAIKHLMEEWQPDIVIVGMPDNRDKNRELLKAIRIFCEEITNRFHIPVETQDESLSSDEAYNKLKSMRKYGGKKIKKEQIDQVAAALILQSWLQSRPS